MRYCIRNGHVLNPATGLNQIANVIIEDSIVTDVVAASVTIGNFDKIIDASGMYVAPGLIDMHVHFRFPGFSYKEDIESGAKSAAAGGFTTVAQMPNTSPVVDNNETLKIINREIAEKSPLEILTFGAITKNQEGKELNDFSTLKNEPTGGICGLSEDGKSVMDSALMMEALEKAKMGGLFISSHCEDKSLFVGGALNDGEVSKALGIKGIPTATEDIITIRDIILAQYTGCHLHLCHVSTKNAVEFIRWAKEKNVNITAETCPHYFTFTDKNVIINGRADTGFKMNPPLRSEEDRCAIEKAVIDGTIDAIVTD
ncbi:MAG: dihydroorotase, partial [Oscillospiraceae bacterium]